MKKIKWTLMTLAVVLSIGSALATHLNQSCQAATQYYFNGTYNLAGKLGLDYICTTPSSAVCTYYKVGTVYTPCMWGSYCTSNCLTGIKEAEKSQIPKESKE